MKHILTFKLCSMWSEYLCNTQSFHAIGSGYQGRPSEIFSCSDAVRKGLFVICFTELELTTSVEQSPSWEANSHSASQEIFFLLWNPEVHYRVHKSPPLVPVLSKMNPVHNFLSYFSKINLIFTLHLCLGLPTGLFPSGFPTKVLYAFLIFPKRATSPSIAYSLIWSPE